MSMITKLGATSSGGIWTSVNGNGRYTDTLLILTIPLLFYYPTICGLGRDTKFTLAFKIYFAFFMYGYGFFGVKFYMAVRPHLRQVFVPFWGWPSFGHQRGPCGGICFLLKHLFYNFIILLSFYLCYFKNVSFMYLCVFVCVSLRCTYDVLSKMSINCSLFIRYCLLMLLVQFSLFVEWFEWICCEKLKVIFTLATEASINFPTENIAWHLTVLCLHSFLTFAVLCVIKVVDG